MSFKNIIKPVAFLGIFVVILAVVSLLFEPQATDKGIEKEEANTIDYLVIGDSEAYASIAPMEIWNEYGFTGYNLGVPGQRLQDTYYLLERSLENQSPKVVLLETNSLHRSSGIYDEFSKILDSIAKQSFAVYKYHNNWKSFNDKKNEEENNKRHWKESVLKGFNYTCAANAYAKGEYREKSDSINYINKTPMYYLNKIIEICSNRNIKLILYTSPSPICWKYDKHNGITDFTQNSDIPFIDLNLKLDELSINWEKDTYDKGDHVNFSGAKKVTKYIGEYLSQNTDLTDHRNDEKYDAWKTNWEEYLKLISEKQSK